MEKVKITLTSGASLEKPLVTAFKVNEGIFVVFDNEMNGTMGLPIILVSKLLDNKLVYIEDAEWESVKQTLRMIIGGNQMDYVTVAKDLAADDNFFKQLTLPVASFDTLKASYKPMESTESVAPVTPVMPEADQVSTPETAPTVEPVNTPAPEVTVEEPVAPVVPVMPNVATTNQEVANVDPAPVAEPVMPTPVPNVEPIPEASDDVVDFTADKEAFLKACENMFDALVVKFKN